MSIHNPDYLRPMVRAAVGAGQRRPDSYLAERGSPTAAHTLGPIGRFMLNTDGKSDDEIRKEIERQFKPTKGWV